MSKGPNRHGKHFRFFKQASFKAGQKVSGNSKCVRTTQKVALPELSSLEDRNWVGGNPEEKEKSSWQMLTYS